MNECRSTDELPDSLNDRHWRDLALFFTESKTS